MSARPSTAKSPSAKGPTLRVLFADDEPALQTLYGNELPRMGHDVTVCKDGQEAIDAADADLFDVAIIDLRMPGKSGWDVIDHLKKVQPETEVIISTGHGNMDDAISALRLGAFDFLPKPAKLATVANLLKRVGERKALANRADQLETQLKAKVGETDIIGSTPAMQQVKTLIAKVAPTESSVLILGETGTGKELVARRVHELSPRSRMPRGPPRCSVSFSLRRHRPERRRLPHEPPRRRRLPPRVSSWPSIAPRTPAPTGRAFPESSPGPALPAAESGSG